MSEKEIKEHERCLKRRLAPVDVKVFSWFYIIAGIICIFLGLLLITGIAHSFPDRQMKLFLGIISISSDIAKAIYTLIMGAINVITGYYLKKYTKIGWWLAFIGCICAILNSISLGFSRNRISASIGILISIVIIIWLLYRRNIFKNREVTK